MGNESSDTCEDDKLLDRNADLSEDLYESGVYLMMGSVRSL